MLDTTGRSRLVMRLMTSLVVGGVLLFWLTVNQYSKRAQAREPTHALHLSSSVWDQALAHVTDPVAHALVLIPLGISASCLGVCVIRGRAPVDGLLVSLALASIASLVACFAGKSMSNGPYCIRLAGSEYLLTFALVCVWLGFLAPPILAVVLGLPRAAARADRP